MYADVLTYPPHTGICGGQKRASNIQELELQVALNHPTRLGVYACVHVCLCACVYACVCVRHRDTLRDACTSMGVVICGSKGYTTED